MYNDKLTVFLSHSHKDVEKVRKIRDILEILGCEPLMFFLKCLDDDNNQLEDFIKREIDARNIFLYCKSDNAEKSVWVQKELEYIKSLDKSRLYEVDIDNDFHHGMVSVLSSIVDMIKMNNVFVSYSKRTRKSAQRIIKYLKSTGMNVVSTDDTFGNFFDFAETAIKKAAKEGVVIFIREEGEEVGYCQNHEIKKAQKEGAKILNVFIKSDYQNSRKPFGSVGMGVPDDILFFHRIRNEIKDGENETYIEKNPTRIQLDKIYKKLTSL